MGGLHVGVLGPLRIRGTDLGGLRSRQSRLLLKVLAVARGHPVSVDRLAEIIWAEAAPASPAKQLAVTVSRARHVLGPDTVRRTDEGYALAIDWLDLAELEDLTTEAQHRLAAGAHAAAWTAAQAGLSLVRGPLLGDAAQGWCVIEWEASKRLISECRLVAAEAALATGHTVDAMHHAEQLIEADPYDEAALRLVMAAYTAAGRPGSALTAYARTREQLIDELGIDPHPDTQATYEAVLRGEPLPGRESSASPPASYPSLPGRGDALAALDQALGSLRDQVKIVVVEGEAGIGKTRLVEVWAADVTARGIPVLMGRCEGIGRALPLQPIADALAVHLHRLEPDVAAAVIGEDAPLLAPLLGTRAPGAATGPSVGDPQLRHEAAQALVFDSVLRVIDRLPGPRPKVLTLDDCHLAATSTIEWLHFAARRTTEASLLIVATMRAEEGHDLPGERICPQPLDVHAVAELVGWENAPELLRRTGGNPLFLTELAAAEPGEVPRTLREAVALRCAKLGVASRTALRTAAVLGDPIDLELVAAVSGEHPLELLDCFERAAQMRLLEERAGHFVFRHEVVRDALAADLSSGRRTWLHKQAATTLARRTDVEPLRVAFHAELGGDRTVAGAALVAAARVASERLDLTEAKRLLDQSIALADTAEARLTRAKVQMTRQQFAAAGDDARTARRLGAGVAAVEIQAWAARYNGQVEQSLRLAEEAVRLSTDPASRMRSLTAVGASMHLLGKLQGAARCLEEATGAENGPDVGPSFWLAWLRIHEGRPSEALALAQRVLSSQGSVLPYAFPLEHALLFEAEALATLGRVADALDVVQRAEAESRRRQTWPRYGGVFYTLRARVLRNVGAVDQADRLDQLALADYWGSPVTGPWALTGLADGRLQAGDLAGASRYLDQMTDARHDLYLHWHHRLDEKLLRARLALATGDHGQARRRAAALASEATRMGTRRHAVLARLTLAQAQARAGEPVELDAVEPDLAAVPEVDGLEAWRLTAELAGDYDAGRWWLLAESRLAQLQDFCGSYREQLGQHARAHLSALRSRRTRAR